MFECVRGLNDPLSDILYIVLGLSLRNTSKAIEPFVDRSYLAIRDWVQRFNSTLKRSLYYIKVIYSTFLL